MTVIYGSSVADTTLTTACQMSTSTGGTETSKQTTIGGGSGNFGEVWSQGQANILAVTSIPATPPGHGWIYYPGAGTFATGNWTPVLTYAVAANNVGANTFRIFKRSGGTYTLLASINFTPTNTAKTAYTLTATSIATFTTAAGDGIYFDLWYQDNTGSIGDFVTIYESSSATAGVASDVQVTTATFTAGGGGNTIVGRAQAKFAEALAARGRSRSTFAEAIGQQSSVRSKFTESIGESGRARAGFVISKGVKGLSRSQFILSKGIKGQSHSRFVESISQRGQGRSKFSLSSTIKGLAESTFKIAVSSGHAITAYIHSRYVTAIKQTGRSRSRFQIANLLHIPTLRSHSLISLPIAAKARAKFVSAIGARAFSRSKFTIAKGLRGLVRSRTTLAASQKVGGRSRFQIAAPLREAARSTFKITAATGHAITAYIRAKYTASIKQTASPRSRFQIRFSQASQVRATFKTAIKSTIPVARSRFLVSLRLVSRSHTKFIIRLFQRFGAQATFKSAAKIKTVAQSRSFTRFGVAVRNTSRFLVAVRVAGRARARFTLSIAQVLRGRTHFLVNQVLVILPIKSITQAVTQALTSAWKVLASLQLSSGQTASLTLTHLQGQSMPAPNSTILSTVTVTDINGAAVSNASVVTATVYFPDGSSTVLSLGLGITNIGNGQYQAKYNTKNSGENREVWSITAADGVTIGSEQFKVGVSY